MPLLLDVDARVNELVSAINHVLTLDGPTGLTMRRIAAASGISTSSMLHHLGSREHMIRVVAAQTARTRRADIAHRARREGALAFLPSRPIAVCAPSRPMGLPEARHTLARQLSLLGCADVTLPDQAVSLW